MSSNLASDLWLRRVGAGFQSPPLPPEQRPASTAPRATGRRLKNPGHVEVTGHEVTRRRCRPPEPEPE